MGGYGRGLFCRAGGGCGGVVAEGDRQPDAGHPAVVRIDEPHLWVYPGRSGGHPHPGAQRAALHRPGAGGAGGRRAGNAGFAGHRGVPCSGRHPSFRPADQSSVREKRISGSGAGDGKRRTPAGKFAPAVGVCQEIRGFRLQRAVRLCADVGPLGTAECRPRLSLHSGRGRSGADYEHPSQQGAGIPGLYLGGLLPAV